MLVLLIAILEKLASITLFVQEINNYSSAGLSCVPMDCALSAYIQFFLNKRYFLKVTQSVSIKIGTVDQTNRQ